MSKENNNNQSEYRFRLFSYFAMAIVSIAILVGLLFLIQHTELNKNQSHVLENQVLLKELLMRLENSSEEALENQNLLKTLGEEAKAHEQREELFLGNNTSTNIGISQNNTKKLDSLLAYFNITFPH